MYGLQTIALRTAGQPRSRRVRTRCVACMGHNQSGAGVSRISLLRTMCLVKWVNIRIVSVTFQTIKLFRHRNCYLINVFVLICGMMLQMTNNWLLQAKRTMSATLTKVAVGLQQQQVHLDRHRLANHWVNKIWIIFSRLFSPKLGNICNVGCYTLWGLAWWKKQTLCWTKWCEPCVHQ